MATTSFQNQAPQTNLYIPVIMFHKWLFSKYLKIRCIRTRLRDSINLVSLVAVIDKWKRFWDKAIRSFNYSGFTVKAWFKRRWWLLSRAVWSISITVRWADERLSTRTLCFSLINVISSPFFPFLFCALCFSPLAVSLTWDSVSRRVYWAL